VFSLEEISDRLEIQHRINLYCHALDNAEWDLLDEVFLPDAILDFSCLNLAPLTWLNMKDRLRKGRRAPFDQHIYANTYITFPDGRGRALTVSKVFNPQGMPGADGNIHFFGNHGEYTDHWERTDAGWRVRHRTWDQKFYSGDYPFPGSLTRADQYALVNSAVGG
jgi:hypothetical protein